MIDISLLHLNNIYFIDKFHHIVFKAFESYPLLTTKIKLNWMFSAQSIIFKQNECSTATKPKYTFALPPRPSQNGEEDFRCQQSVKIYLLRISTDGPQKQFIFNQHRFFLPLDVSVLPHYFRWIFTLTQVMVCLNLTNIELSRKYYPRCDKFS